MIPKILHQIWIGPKPAPSKLMDSWKQKHPGFEYIRWNEQLISEKGIRFECQTQIDAMQEINGKADIIRWELLYEYGGYFVDADSICVEPFDEYFENVAAFATYENENVRAGLVATGTMGFIPKHPLIRDIIDWMRSSTEAQHLIRTTRAWYSVGPGLLTKMLDTGKYRDFAVYPSHCFLPIHFTGPAYEGHKKVYGYQEWGTAKQSYDTMNQVVLPKCLLRPARWISVLVSSYNTDRTYIIECLNSVKAQIGHFGIELVWVDDGSTADNHELLCGLLSKFEKTSRFTTVNLVRLPTNRGTPYALNRGLKACTYPLIFKMDSDDIMMPDRILKQMEYMDRNPTTQILGTGAQFFMNDPESPSKRIPRGTTAHPTRLSKPDFLQKKPHWFMNHPSICYRKDAVLKVGGYNETDPGLKIIHDYELYLRFLREYGFIDNLPDVLMHLRLRSGQLTDGLDVSSPESVAYRNTLIASAGLE